MLLLYKKEMNTHNRKLGQKYERHLTGKEVQMSIHSEKTYMTLLDSRKVPIRTKSNTLASDSQRLKILMLYSVMKDREINMFRYWW